MIEVKGITKFYGDFKALDDVSFSVKKGEVLGFLGPNGAGKSTTMKVLTTYISASEGTASVDGFDVHVNPHEVRKRIGYLPDTPPVYPEMTVEEYLRFAAKLRGVPADKLDERVGDAMELTETLAERDQRIGTLSHGFRQRVGIAQAIVHEPELVVLDEPISGLDPVQIVEMRDLVRSLGGERTVVVSSHILGEISETCDRIFVIGNGEIVASGTEAELSSRLLKGMRVELTLRVGDRAREAEALLVEVAGVDQVEAVEGVERGKGIQSFLLHAQRDVREAVAQALVGAGFGVLELSRGERELESVFLELSGPADGKKKKKKKRAAADDAPPPAPQQEAES